MENQNDDPFASITALCHVSSSQEEHLRHCRFAFEPEPDSDPLFSDDSAGTPLASTGIFMVSPPETPEENADVFRTPPEESALPTSQEQQPAAALGDDQSVVGVGNDGEFTAVICDGTEGESKTVDLGRDTDLGFSMGEESTVRVESGDSALEREVIINSESVENGELISDFSLCESPSKKLKIADNSYSKKAEKKFGILEESTEKLQSPLKRSQVLCGNSSVETSMGSLGGESERMLGRLVKSMVKLKSPMQLSKFMDKSLVLETSKVCLDGEKDKRRHRLGKSIESLRSERVGMCNDGLKTPQVDQIEEMVNEMRSGDKESCEESSAKRKLEFCAEVLEFDYEENNTDLSFDENRMEGVSYEKEIVEVNELGRPSERHSAQKSIDDIDKFRYTGPSCSNSCEKEKGFRAKRTLPASIYGKETDQGGDIERHGFYHREVTLLDVLQMLAHNSYYDPNLESLSVLEAAKRRGMTFP